MLKKKYEADSQGTQDCDPETESHGEDHKTNSQHHRTAGINSNKQTVMTQLQQMGSLRPAAATAAAAASAPLTAAQQTATQLQGQSIGSSLLAPKRGAHASLSATLPLDERFGSIDSLPSAGINPGLAAVPAAGGCGIDRIQSVQLRPGDRADSRCAADVARQELQELTSCSPRSLQPCLGDRFVLLLF